MDFAGMMQHERKKRAEEKKREKEREAAQALASQGAEEGAPSPAADGCLPLPSPLAPTAVPAPELACLAGAPGTVWYCDQFLSAAEAADLERAIRSQHRPGEWHALTKRRLLNLGGVPHPDGMLAEQLPDWMQLVLDRLAQAEVFPTGTPNQCLLNEYEAGQGIDPHMDGPLYHPRAAILSLVTPALLRFVEPQTVASHEEGQHNTWTSRTTSSVLMRPGSLVVFADEAYERLLHGVSGDVREEVAEHTANRALVGAALGDDITRGNRLSLTIRSVHTVAVQAGEFLQPEQQREAARRRAWWTKAISEKVK